MRISAELVVNGSPLAPNLGAVLDEAIRDAATIADESDRKKKSERLEQIRLGEFDLVVVRDGGHPIGFLAFQSTEDEAMLRYGHILSPYDRAVETILAAAIDALERHGIDSISSIFNWPQREAFIKAADSLGFAAVDRMNMVRDPDAGPVSRSLPARLSIVPWSQAYLETSARILFENSFPEDRVFHRPYRRPQGCLAYLRAIVNGSYGQFLPDLSFVACHEDAEVGLLMTTRSPRVGVEVEELVVDGPFRGRGIATSLIGDLICANAAASNDAIVLSVTRSNAPAFRLYRRMGFKVTDEVTYFAYDRRVQRTD